MTPTAELLAIALKAAEAAARVHLLYRGRVGVRDAVQKGPSDFVSFVDTEAEKAALDVIRERFPEHAILAEESPMSAGSSPSGAVRAGGPLWIVDPLDGTTNYLHGHPMYSASVGVAIGGEPTVGAIVASETEDRWWAEKGAGAYRNGERIHTSSVRNMAEALVGTGFPFRRPEELPRYLEEFRRVFGACSGIRRGGSAALDFCYLAQGSLDAFWEGNLAPWDVAAGRVILAEAGGAASRRDGSPIETAEDGSVVAANSAELLEAVRMVLGP
ncbi:MAG: inositol monophosphatase [Gemmatimonadetes bacterium]|nr:inositol monophosphatase [Gemmatimonadota bacterium]